MRKKLFPMLPVLLLAAFASVILVPQAGHTFWYGAKITPEHIDSPTSEALHQYILDNILFTVPGPDNDFSDSLRGADNNPDGITGLRIYKPEKTWDGYTLLSSLGGHSCDPDDPRVICNTILINMEGELVKEWVLGAVPAKMLPDGYVMGSFPGRNDTGFRGSKILQQQDWCGEEVWRYDNFGELGGADWHHDHQRAGNPVGYYAPGLRTHTDKGRTLILSHDYPGMVPEVSTFPLLDDKIYEIDWGGTVLFEWYASEHFDQMGFHAEAQDAIMNIQVGRPPTPTTDWQHLNSASYVGPNPWFHKGMGDLRFDPRNIIYDSRTANYMAIIARHDHPDWPAEGTWQAGDIVWKVGPHYSSSYKEHRLGQIIGLHHAHLIPRGLPGWGNVLVFDNGGIAGYDSFLPGMPGHYPATYRNYSRVIEFDPITLEIIWEYQDPVQEGDVDLDGEIKGDERLFYSNLISGAQRLKNGNTLITEGHGGRVFEVTYEGEIVWEYISPYEDGRAPRATDPNAVYRAYRVPDWWVPHYKDCD